VTAGVGGTIAEILLDNAQFAAQGAVLMRVREQR
jgi:biotin carboxyl carrier protein